MLGAVIADPWRRQPALLLPILDKLGQVNGFLFVYRLLSGAAGPLLRGWLRAAERRRDASIAQAARLAPPLRIKPEQLLDPARRRLDYIVQVVRVRDYSLF